MNASARGPLDRGLPNRSAIATLIQRYYGGRDSSADVSSHWRRYSGMFEVEVGADGALLRLEGHGFGNARWGSLAHRWADRACEASLLAHLPRGLRIRRLRGLLDAVCRRAGLDPTLDAFRQLCTLALLDQYLEAVPGLQRNRVLLIGDGYGVLGALLKERWPDARLVFVDIGQTLLFQLVHCQRAHPSRTHVLAGSDAVLGDADFVYCPSDQLRELEHLDFDMAVNVASMQEMAPATVEAYFSFLRRRLRSGNLFYCCNRESKRLSGGELSEFARYPWGSNDRILVDGPCPWHQYFFTPGRAKNAPSVMGVRMPLVGYYDGRTVHRLVVLETERG